MANSFIRESLMGFKVEAQYRKIRMLWVGTTSWGGMQTRIQTSVENVPGLCLQTSENGLRGFSQAIVAETDLNHGIAMPQSGYMFSCFLAASHETRE